MLASQMPDNSLLFYL